VLEARVTTNMQKCCEKEKAYNRRKEQQKLTISVERRGC
jgi:hypothetical protein